MNTSPTLFVAVAFVLLSAGCSKSSSSPAVSEARAVQELPEQQVIDIVNAVSSKNITKAASLLKSNPKLVGAKFENGGPVNGWPLLLIAASNNDKPMVELLFAPAPTLMTSITPAKLQFTMRSSKAQKRSCGFSSIKKRMSTRRQKSE